MISYVFCMDQPSLHTAMNRTPPLCPGRCVKLEPEQILTVEFHEWQRNVVPNSTMWIQCGSNEDPMIPSSRCNQVWGPSTDLETPKRVGVILLLVMDADEPSMLIHTLAVFELVGTKFTWRGRTQLLHQTCNMHCATVSDYTQQGAVRARPQYIYLFGLREFVLGLICLLLKGGRSLQFWDGCFAGYRFRGPLSFSG